MTASGQAAAALESAGFKSADLALTPGQMLENILAVQREFRSGPLADPGRLVFECLAQVGRCEDVVELLVQTLRDGGGGVGRHEQADRGGDMEALEFRCVRQRRHIGKRRDPVFHGHAQRLELAGVRARVSHQFCEVLSGTVSYMTDHEFALRFQAMSGAQDLAAGLVLPFVEEALMAHVKLCGGTALGRFHLHHRISYDLDFFVPEGIGFNAQALADRIASKVKIQGLEVTHDVIKADQLHFFVPIPGGDPIKMSFVEDMYATTFPAVATGVTINGIQIQTEPVQGLYHRKLRTVVGWAGGDAVMPSGGRQTARDMFDLFVLSQAVMPLKPFIESLPYAFPLEAFTGGIAVMPWFDISDELAQTIAAPAWESGQDVSRVRDHLFKELGMVEIPPEPTEDEDEQPASQTGRRRP